ncbi:hypothetical protein EFN09_09740 [Propionibacterium freudenreichii]|nr:hypothetical protein [Propionibacterium freudenreichii]MCT2993160.1 hypothetical protein [Propionibacterium freudenreichii]
MTEQRMTIVARPLGEVGPQWFPGDADWQHGIVDAGWQLGMAIWVGSSAWAPPIIGGKPDQRPR